MPKKRMTKEELIERLKECKHEDVAVGHTLADSLLIDYIGDEEVKRAFDDLTKWYE